MVAHSQRKRKLCLAHAQKCVHSVARPVRIKWKPALTSLSDDPAETLHIQGIIIFAKKICTIYDVKIYLHTISVVFTPEMYPTIRQGPQGTVGRVLEYFACGIK